MGAAGLRLDGKKLDVLPEKEPALFQVLRGTEIPLTIAGGDDCFAWAGPAAASP
jgi:hypothetical protein